MIGIYKITNKINGKVYIGQSLNIELRWKQHIQEAKNSRKQTKFYNAMRKYGIDNFIFQIIEQCQPSQQILDEKQRYWIQYYNSYKEGYNSTLGGQLKNSWIKYNPQSIKKLWDEGYSVQQIINIIGCGKTTVQNYLNNYKDYNLHTSHSRGITRSIKNKNGNSKIFQNNKYFQKPKEVHQYSLKGQYITSYTSLNQAARALGKNKGGQSGIIQALQENDNRLTAYGYQWSLKKVEKLPPVPVHGGKLVQCIETGQIFTSTAQAAKWCNLKSSSGIKDCCRGYKCKTAGKHPQTGEKLSWKYI